MRIAIVHPWFIGNGGGERVIAALATICPTADFFTLILDRQTLSPDLHGRNIYSSFLSAIPGAAKHYQHLMPFYHLAATTFDLRGYDLVISSGGPATKGVILDQGARHIHYCHSPVRFLWDQFPAWYQRLPVVLKPLFAHAAHSAREWDFNSAQRVDEVYANSEFVAERVQSYYRRSSTVIYPPVETRYGYLAETEDYFLCVSRLVPNKRMDVLVNACNVLGMPLLIVGDGPERKSLEAMAGDTIRFLGRVDDAALPELYAHARGFLFAAEEDFGIALVEAQSYGVPVIAFGRGGACETVVDSRAEIYAQPTGVLFREQTVDSMCEAIYRFLAIEDDFDRAAIQQHAKAFDTSVFMSRMQEAIYRPESYEVSREFLPALSVR